MENRRFLYANVFLLSVLVLVLAAPANAQAHRLSRFVEDDELKQEVLLRGGVSLPLGDVKTLASTGGMAGFAYHYYPIPWFFLGAHLDAHLLGYDFSSITPPSNASVRKSGWEALGIAATIGGRIPLGVYGLYFTTHIAAGYGMMISPSMRYVYKTPAPTEANPNRTIRTRTTVIAATLKGNFYLNGGMGVEYRFKQHWIARFMVDYSYMPSEKSGADHFSAETFSAADPSLKLSAFVLGIGFSYAF